MLLLIYLLMDGWILVMGPSPLSMFFSIQAYRNLEPVVDHHGV